jgi:hypothetical protein
MDAITIKRTLATALAGAVVGTAGATPAWGMPADPLRAPGDAPSVAPPPSSIAASAAEEYEILRMPGYQDAPVPEPAAGPSEGFDLPSAAIGAAGTGLIIVLAAGGLAWRRPLTRRHGAARA